ncbi:hypothetical protein [Burkholderia ubonensis]|uniref:hypothetical protein n=1 Tax=Burkholderia ubonensis TaxID=101571 RepID=UPI00075A08D2|nr:hypothetical protein [Burkholderia ubonensis]KWI10905.1 hypothetical protein WM01_19300 [Burkholderia ubonensis]OJA94460.1 hypothetical protein BGV51_28290 [Burkholderia ubonensis]
MITIKVLPDRESDRQTCWYYGPDFMKRITRATARKLCGLYPLPDMGSETCVARSLGQARLFVQNVCGDFYVASPSDRSERWPEIFGVEARYA